MDKKRIKKSNGGIVDEQDLILPGDAQEVDSNNLVSTIPEPSTIPEMTGFGGQIYDAPSGSATGSNAADILRGPTGAREVPIDYHQYSKYIDEPFSVLDETVDDRRAMNQPVGEKIRHAIPKFGAGLFTNITGAIIGIPYGLSKMIQEGVDNGFDGSAAHKFFNNDFQRSLDGINEAMGEKFPHYYTQAENSAPLGKQLRSANFWTDQLQQGLSFMAGAVLTEFITAGTGKYLMGTRLAATATNKIKNIAALRNAQYTQTAVSGAQKLKQLDRFNLLAKGATGARRMLTGAFYEAGVEARHNFDETIDSLIRKHTEITGEAPNQDDLKEIEEIATATSNGVFAMNTALVGYSNMLVFKNIYGVGMRNAKQNFAKGFWKNIKKDAGKFIPKYKDFSNLRNFGAWAWTLGKTGLYEGFVEEGGQNVLRHAGIDAAEDYYLDGKNPTSLEGVGGVLNNSWDNMANAYGSVEGQKEIFMGFLLGSMGLPTGIRTNKKTGKREWGLGWTGGIKDQVISFKQKRKNLDLLAGYMNENPDAISAIKGNFDMLVDQKNAANKRDFAIATDNDFSYKNADHDAFFSYIFHRLQGGYYADALQSIEDIRSMDNESFAHMFGYDNQIKDMTESEKDAFLNERKDKVADSHAKRANDIKNLYDNTSNLDISDNARKMLVHAYSSAKDKDAREDLLIRAVEEITGASMTEVDDRGYNDSKSNEEVKKGAQNFATKTLSWIKKKMGREAADVVENSKPAQTLKRKLGIKEFNKPGDVLSVYAEMLTKKEELEKLGEYYAANNMESEFNDIVEQLESLNKEIVALQKGFKKGIEPDLSSEERQLLDDYRKKDPSGYEQNKEGLIQKLQDLRRIRAARHQALNLVQQLVDKNAEKDLFQRIEKVISDKARTAELENMSELQKSNARKHRGKMIEVEYTDEKGKKRKTRAFYKENSNKGIVLMPDPETFKLIKELELIGDPKTLKDRERKEAIEKELANKVTEYTTKSPDWLENADNITNLSNEDLQLEKIKSVIDVLNENYAQKLKQSLDDSYELGFKLMEISEQLLEVTKAIQNQQSKQGNLVVNLSKIGGQVNASLASALQKHKDLQKEEARLQTELQSYERDYKTLEDNSLKMQVIHALMSDPKILEDITNTPGSINNARELIYQFLGLDNEISLYEDLANKGYFNKYDLKELVTKKDDSGKTIIDADILQELINKVRRGNDVTEYLDLINNDLAEFKTQLNKLKELKKITEDSIKWLDGIRAGISEDIYKNDYNKAVEDLENINLRIKNISSVVDTLSKETAQALKDTAKSVEEDLVEFNRSYELQRQIEDSLSAYEQWLSEITSDPKEEVQEDGKDVETSTSTTVVSELYEEDQKRSPSLTEVPFLKTAGSHAEALRVKRELDQRRLEKKLSKAEEMQYEHVMAQLRFFKASENLDNWDKSTGAKLMVVTRYNIPEELKDKIIFFDLNAKKNQYRYEKDLTENKDRNEEKEDIKLVLVDKNLNPILIDGNIAYTNMPSSQVYDANNQYRFGSYKDGVHPDFTDEGTLKPEVENVIDNHIKNRQEVLKLAKPAYYYISGKGKGYPIWENNNPDSRGTILGRLVLDSEDLKNIDIKVALSNIVQLSGNEYSAIPGHTYVSHKGNMVPIKLDQLSAGQANNIYNVIRLFSQGQTDIGGKSMTGILKDIVYFGKMAKNRKLQGFSLYIQNDAFYFGNQGKNITIDQLNNPNENTDINEEFKAFLQTLSYNVHSRHLQADTDARNKARAEKNRLIKEAKKEGNKEKLQAALNININDLIEYTPHVEVRVSDDLQVETITWDNYTQFLVDQNSPNGTKRDLADIPAKVNMNLDYSKSENVQQSEVPQYNNIYITHEGVLTPAASVIRGEENQQDAQDNEIDNASDPKTATGEEIELEKIDLTDKKDIEKEDRVKKLGFTEVETNLDDINDEEDIYFLADSIIPTSDVDIDSELEWFNNNMPKDENGNPLFTISFIKGLIDNKGLGKFLGEGKILISDVLTTSGVVYHEAFHGITRSVLSQEDRFKLYDEARSMKGKIRTYKGEVKKMSELTDKEADEWLAEEFRSYVLANGNYTVGKDIKKSFIDRIFDFINNILNYFVNNESQAQRLFENINTGYFSDPVNNITVYRTEDEAYMEERTLKASFINDAMEGMTANLFNKAAEKGNFELEDFFNLTDGSITNKILNLYGTTALEPGSIIRSLVSNTNTHIKQLESKKAQAVSESNINFYENEIAKIKKNRQTILDSWEELQTEHHKYLKQKFKIQIEEVDLDQDEAYNTPEYEIDPNKYLSNPLRLLISTLPKSELSRTDRKQKFTYNKSGFAKLVDFGNTMSYLYKNLSNTHPNNLLAKLEYLSTERPELSILRKRLGITNKDFSGLTVPQMNMVIKLLIQFDQSANTFWTQMIDRESGRYLVDSNSNRVERLITDAWKSNFRDNINIDKLGKIENGKLVVDPNKKIKADGRTRTIKEWGNTPKTAIATLEILSKLGIRFSDNVYFMSEYKNDSSVRNASSWIIKEVSRTPIDDLYKGDIQANLKTLLNLEKNITNFAIDLQHRNAEGKTVHGVNLKTAIDVLVTDLNSNPNRVIELLSRYNLANSTWLQKLSGQRNKLEVHILEGVSQKDGKSKLLSRGLPSDIAVMHINSILKEGIVPIIATSDKKTPYGIKIEEPSLNIPFDGMILRMQGYLFDEIKTANLFNTTKSSKLHRIKNYKDQGGRLRYFKNFKSIPEQKLRRPLEDNEILEIIQSKEVQNELREMLSSIIEGIKSDLINLNVVRQGKNNFINVGIDLGVLSKLKKGQDVSSEGTMSIKTFNKLAEQLAIEHTTGIIEQSKVLFGDLALYKDDIFKRSSGIVGTKKYPTNNRNILSWMNENMPNLMLTKEHSDKIRTVTRKGINVDAQYLDDYVDVLSILNPSLVPLIQNVYTNMEEFDGGGFIHLDTYRSLLFRTGQWADKQEKAYLKVLNNEELSAEDFAAFPPLKPQAFSNFTVDNIELKTFHKYALFPLIPQIMPGDTYQKIHDDMTTNNVDYMVFDSAVKVGAVMENSQGFDPFYEKRGDFNDYKPMSLDENNEPLALQELDFSSVGIQLDIAPKAKYEVPIGTQSNVLISLNIFDNGQLNDKYKDTPLESEINEFQKLNSVMIERDLTNLAKELGLEKTAEGYKLKNNSAKAFSEVVLNELNKRDLPLHTKRGIELLFKQDSKFINKLFEKNKIETILYALVTNSVIKRKMPGDMMTLQANTGMETMKALKQNDFAKAKELGIDLQGTNLKPLKFYRPNKDGTLAMQVYVPHRFKEIQGENINVNDPLLDKKLLELIGFRIPTEGLNSIDFIEIAGYLPPSMGSVVIVPSEIVGKAGSDYDIDKLIMYYPNYVFNDDTQALNKIPYLTEENSTAEERLSIMKEQEPSTYEDMSLSEFSKLSIEEQNTKKALQNRYQDIMRNVLKHPLNFDQLITPVGAYDLSGIANEISQLRNQRGKIKTKSKEFNDILSLGNLVNQSYRMWSGLGGVGVVATSATQHSKAQRAGIAWNPDKVDINFQNSQFLSLSNVNDIANRRSISSVIGQYVTGYVDVTKEDFVFDINAGFDYAPIHMLLIRSGVPLESVLYFMSQPIIDDYVKLKETTSGFSLQYSKTKAYKSQTAIIRDLKRMYGEPSDTEFSEGLLRSMIGKNLEDLNPMERGIQARILDDFIRYEGYSKELLLLQEGTKFDTSRLRNSMSVKHTQASLKRVYENDMIENIDNLIYDNNQKFQMMKALKMAFDEAPKMFSDIDIKHKYDHIRRFMDQKMYELTNPKLFIPQEQAIYIMEKFDSFLSSVIAQTTPINDVKLNEKISALFQGDNSLPNQVARAQRSLNLSDNLLIKELYPILQTTKDAKDPNFTIDSLKLFNKKLQSYDIDLLSDAYYELKEINPKLAKDLVEFSLLQSGFNYSPIAFFQVLPSTEVLNIIGPYFDANPITNLNMNNAWHEFHQNSWNDSKIVPRLSYKGANKELTTNRAGTDYIAVSEITGTETIGNITKNIYDTKLFMKSEDLLNSQGSSLYIQIPKKGNGMYLQEINMPSILTSNISKIDKKSVSLQSDQGNQAVENVYKNNIESEKNRILEDKDNCKPGKK